MPKQATRRLSPPASRLTRSATPVSFIWVWLPRSMSMDIASSDGVCHHGSWSRGGLPLVWPCAGCSSFMATNLPHGTLFRWLRWPTLAINQKNVFAFNGMHHMFTFMHQFRVILDMHALTMFKQCLSLQYNLQLIKPQNKWLQLFNLFINFPSPYHFQC